MNMQDPKVFRGFNIPVGPMTASLAVKCLLLLVVLAFEVFRSWTVLPLPDGDQLVFYPLYLEVAHTGELSHRFYSPIAHGFPAPMNWHGWLQPWLLGHITRLLGGDISAALLSEAIFIVGGLALFIVAQKPAAKVPPLLVIVGGMAVAASLSGAKGRPELLAGFVMLGWYALHSRIDKNPAKVLVTGVALGALGSIHPTVAFLFSLFLFAYAMVQRHPFPAFGRWLSANLLAAVLVALGAALVVPGGLVSWLTGLAEHAAVTGARPASILGAHHYLLLSTDRFMHGLILLVATLYVLAWLFRTGKASVASLAAIAICLCAAWYFGVRLPPTAYNLLVFVPLAVCLLLRLPDLPRLANRAIVTSVVAAAALGLPLQMAATAFSHWYGVSRGEFSATFERIAASRIIIDPSLLVGAIPFEKWQSLRPWRQGATNLGDADVRDPGPRCAPDSVVITKQANTGLLTPQQPVPGCGLLAETFRSVRISLLGKELILIPKAYQYAIFGPDRRQ
jgi:hypothetical protein